MHNSLRHHILFLEDALQELNRQLTSPSTPPDVRATIEERITLAASALRNYREAYETEAELRKLKFSAD